MTMHVIFVHIVLDLFVMFGGYTIYVPQDWNVIIDLVPIFGGFSDKRVRSMVVKETDRSIVISGTCIFGGGEIVNYH